MGVAPGEVVGPPPPSRELAHVRYFIDGSVDAGVQGKLAELLNAYGAAECKLLSASEGNQDADGQPAASTSTAQGHIDLDDVTHIITMTMQFHNHEAVEARNNQVLQAAEASGKQISTAPNPATGGRGDVIAIVTPLWVTKTCDYKKRQEEQFFSPDPAKIFSGVTICTEGLLPGDSEVVKGIVSALGGQWRGPLVAEVTHLICLNLKGKKSQRLLASGLRLGMKAVLPHWIDDCVKLHLRVPEDPYIFPNPPCFDTVIRKPIPYEERLGHFFKSIGKRAPNVNNYSSSILDPHVIDGESQHSAAKEQLTSPALSSSDPSKQLLARKSVYISSSCELSPEKLQTLLRKIKEYGGEPLAGANIQENAVLINRADIVIVDHREGWEFWKAYESGKTLGNLDWLIYILFEDLGHNGAKLPSPTDRLLHWPWPRATAEGFKDTNFTVSGYVGQARETIKRMIELLGGTFEGTLTKNKTTHLIASVQSGSKFTHAKPWGIPIVNHRWIEDSFRHWRAADVLGEKYLDLETSAIASDLPTFAAGRAIDLEDVKRWAEEPAVKQERDASLLSLGDAIVDELDDAQEEELLLSSPAPSDRGISPVQHNTILQKQQSYREMALDMDAESSPLPSLKDTIAATQFRHPPSPLASDHASDTVALATATRGKPKKLTAKAMQSIATSTPHVKRPTRGLEPPSSVSDYDEVKQEPVDKKRKRELAGLGEFDSGLDHSLGYTGRKAAQAATQKLRDTIMPDVMRYEKEKRGGGKGQLDEMFGGKAPGSSAKKPPSTHARNRSDGKDGVQSAIDSDAGGSSAPPGHAKSSKRVRVDSPSTPQASVASRAIKGRGVARQPQARAASPQEERMSDGKPAQKHLSTSKVVREGRKPHIASTGAVISADQRKALMKLGCKMLGDNIEGCTHLVVKGISRTVKFLTAIPMGAIFVTEQWVHDSVAAGQLLDEEKYLLKDKEGEAKHSMSLARSLSLARRSKLLNDHTFYITPNVQPSFEALKSISEAAGAKVIKKLPTVKQVSDRADVYVISSAGERSTWEHLANQGIPIYSGEALIKAVMQQQTEFELYRIDEDEDE